jgi:preprotein translocase subunit SecG
VSALIIVLHVIVCLVLIFAILLQSGKAADLAGAFGGGGSQTAFGARGNTSPLSKVTTAAAIIFMLTSLGLWILSGRGASSVVGGEKAPAAATVPAAKPEDKGATTPPAAQPEQKPAEKPPVPASATTGSPADKK